MWGCGGDGGGTGERNLGMKQLRGWALLMVNGL